VLRPVDLRYTLVVPAGYADDAPTPLIVALHYAGPPFPYKGGALIDGLVHPALGHLGAIIAAPDCPTADWANTESEGAVMALVDHLVHSYSIDPARTLLTGYSIGGIGTWYIAGRHQAQFAAALPISARPPHDVLKREWSIPLYVIHSRDDELFPLSETEAIVRALRDAGSAVEFAIVEDVTHFETHRFVGPLRSAVPWLQRLWAR
jgi:predicted peptidase